MSASKNGTVSAGPGGGADYAAEILRLERRVLVGEHVRIDRAKGGLGPVPHPIVEGLDDLLLEVARARVSVNHGPALVVRELVIGDAHYVHLDTGRNKGDDRMHVRRDAGGRMQRNGGPHRGDIALGDAMPSEAVTRCVSAVHLEPVVRARVPAREADVVEHGTGVEKLVIETQPAPPAGESAPVIDTARMMEQQRRLCIPHDDAGSDLDQTKADRCELCSRQRRALRSGAAHGKHKPVGGGVQDQAELVGFGIAAGGAVGSELALVQLDEVLGVSPRAIEGLVNLHESLEEEKKADAVLTKLAKDEVNQ